MLSTLRPLKVNKNIKHNLVMGIGTAGLAALEYDISSNSSVKGDNFTDESGQPEITNVIELPHDPAPLVEEKTLLRSIRRDIDEIKKNFSQTRIDCLTVILSSPWFFSESRKISMERDSPFIIDRGLLNNLLDEEKNIFSVKSSSQFSVSETDGVELMETAIMRVLLNGYETDAFLDKSVRQMRFFIYLSLTLTNLLTDLRGLIEEKFGPKKMVIHSSPYILLKSAMSALEVDKSGAIFIDIGGEITDIVVIRGGIIEANISFGRGLHFLLRRIATAMSLNTVQALSLLKTLNDGNISDVHAKQISEIVNSAINEWKGMLRDAIAPDKELNFLPSRFCLTGEGADFKIFSDALTEGEIQSRVNKNTPMKIEVLYPKIFRNHMRGDGKYFSAGPSATGLFLSVYSPEYSM